MDDYSQREKVRRPWWKRALPVRIRHHSRMILSSLLVLLLMGFMLGSYRINPIVFSHESVEQITNSRFNIIGQLDLFDLDEAHSINLTISNENYRLIMEDYLNNGLKTWVAANIEIDGTLISNIGVRLKGNSTLRELSRNSRGWGRRNPMSNASFDNPSTLPLAVSFDKYEDGLAYQGREELAIRPARAGGTNLNEAIALQLIADSGQVSQDFTWVRFRVNDYPTTTRLVIENPDKRYAEAIGMGSGVLYKSRSENRFRYRGEEDSDYENDFDQINAKSTQGMSPVIELLKWLEAVSIEDFDRELADWVDIESFAYYVATQDLLENFDDMSGPGKNFLLWYDLTDEKFTVISWDMNLALGTGNFLGGFGYGYGNFLKERFVRSELFQPEIQKAREALLQSWTDRNSAVRTLDKLSESVPLSDALTEEQALRDLSRVRRSLQLIR
jgi:spore coat protein CotH